MGWFFPLLCTATWGAGQPPASLGRSSLLPRDVATRPRCPHGSRCQRSHGEGTWPVGDAVGAVPLPPADSGPVLLRDAAAGVAQGEGMLPKCAHQGGRGERRGKKGGRNVPTAWLGAQSPGLCLKREDSGLLMSREALGGRSGRDLAAPRSCCVLGRAQFVVLCAQPRGPAGPILPGAG